MCSGTARSGENPDSPRLRTGGSPDWRIDSAQRCRALRVRRSGSGDGVFRLYARKLSSADRPRRSDEPRGHTGDTSRGSGDSRIRSRFPEFRSVDRNIGSVTRESRSVGMPPTHRDVTPSTRMSPPLRSDLAHTSLGRRATCARTSQPLTPRPVIVQTDTDAPRSALAHTSLGGRAHFTRCSMPPARTSTSVEGPTHRSRGAPSAESRAAGSRATGRRGSSEVAAPGERRGGGTRANPSMPRAAGGRPPSRVSPPAE